MKTGRVWVSMCLVCAVVAVTAAAGGLVVPLRPSPSSSSAEVVLVNDDRLSGELVSIDVDGFVLLKHLLMGSKMRIPLAAVRSIDFGGTKVTASVEGKGGDSVVLLNGDTISGLVKEMNDSKVIVETVYAGMVGVERKAVDFISFNSGGRVLLSDDFSGSGLGKWVGNRGRWVVKSGKLVQQAYTSCYVYRPLRQSGPLVFDCAVEAAGAGRLEAGIAVFASDRNTMYGGSSYYVVLSGGMIYVNKMERGRRNEIADVRLPVIPQRARCTISCDPGSGTVEVVVNGRVITRFIDATPIREGRYVILSASGPVAFDYVRVLRGGARMRYGDNPSADVLFMLNGDRTSGKVLSLKDGKVAMETAFGVISVDTGTVSSLRFGRSRSASPSVKDGAVVLLKNDDRFTMRIKRLEGGVLEGITPYAGEVAIRREYLQRVMLSLPVGGKRGG